MYHSLQPQRQLEAAGGDFISLLLKVRYTLKSGFVMVALGAG